MESPDGDVISFKAVKVLNNKIFAEDTTIQNLKLKVTVPCRLHVSTY
jgi:hypothetical protein